MSEPKSGVKVRDERQRTAHFHGRSRRSADSLQGSGRDRGSH